MLLAQAIKKAHTFSVMFVQAQQYLTIGINWRTVRLEGACFTGDLFHVQLQCLEIAKTASAEWDTALAIVPALRAADISDIDSRQCFVSAAAHDSYSSKLYEGP